MNQNDEINCHNCAYFMQHYIIDKHCRLAKVQNCGHCVNNNSIDVLILTKLASIGNREKYWYRNKRNTSKII